MGIMTSVSRLWRNVPVLPGQISILPVWRQISSERLSSFNWRERRELRRIEQSDSNIIKRTLGVDGPAAEAFGPLIDEYDIRQKWSNQTEFKPPSTYSTWLSDSAIVKAIGAQGHYTECSGTVSDQFTSTGDGMYFSSSTFTWADIQQLRTHYFPSSQMSWRAG